MYERGGLKSKNAYEEETLHVRIPLTHPDFHVLFGIFDGAEGVPPLVRHAQQRFTHTLQTRDFTLNYPGRIDDEDG